MRNQDARALLRDAKRLIGELEAMVNTPDGPKPLVVFARDRLYVQADRSLPGRDGSGSGKGEHSDPTAARVLDETDQAIAARINAARANLDDALVTAVQRLGRARDIASSAAITRYHAPRSNPGCRNCARVTLHDGTAHPEAWQPVYALGLCRWCYLFEHGNGPNRPGYGVPPVIELVAWHLDHLGSEAPRTLIRDLMPDEYGAREELRRRLASRRAHPAGEGFHDGPRADFSRNLHAVGEKVES